MKLKVNEFGETELFLGVQTNPDKIEEDIFNKAKYWCTKKAKSFNYRFVNTDYHGHPVENITGYGNLYVECFSTEKEGKHLLNVYSVRYSADGNFEILKNDSIFSPNKSLKVRNHSPTGFNFGYSGSGPSQLALAILLEETDSETAQRAYQDFKFEVISCLPKEEWKITSFDVSKWLEKWKEKHDIQGNL